MTRRTKEADVVPPDTRPYLYTVYTAQGYQFSIAKDLETAEKARDQIGGSIRPYVCIPSTYWDDSSSHYDH